LAVSTISSSPVDVDLLQLIDEDHRRVAVLRDVARGDLDRETVVRAVAVLFHQRAGLGAVLCDIGAIARQLGQTVGRQAPLPGGRRLHRAVDSGRYPRRGLEERLAIDRQLHRATDFGVAEGRLVAVDEKPRPGSASASSRRFAFGAWLLTSRIIWVVTSYGKVISNLAGDKGEVLGRPIGDDCPLDPVENTGGRGASSLGSGSA